MDIEQVNLESNTKNANLVKELVLVTLLNNKDITEEAYNKYITTHEVIILKRGWFKSLMSKNNDAWVYKIIETK